MYEWAGFFYERPDQNIVERVKAIISNGDPEDYNELVCNTFVLWFEEKYDEAVEKATLAIPLYPDLWGAFFWQGLGLAYLQLDEEAIAAIRRALELKLPPGLLAPLRWLAQDRPEFYRQYAAPLLEEYKL